VILWKDLTFWTAVGQLGIGMLAGLAIGMIVREARRFVRPPATHPEGGICPACGARSLRRVRGSAVQRVVAVFTRRWPSACRRCGWPSMFPTADAIRPVARRMPDSGPSSKGLDLDDLVLHETDRVVTKIVPKDVVTKDVVTKDVVAKDVVAKSVVAKNVAAKSVAAKSVAAKNVATKDVVTEDAVTQDVVTEDAVAQDDVAEVKAAVLRYLAMLNAGDVAARANCYLSGFTSFGVDGGRLAWREFDWRTAGADRGRTYDLRCRDLRVYVHKDTAIATAYLVGTITRSDGASKPVTGRSSWVHLRQDGEWKIAHTHLSPLNGDS
jgi:ketosteroid isomerase-like protein